MVLKYGDSSQLDGRQTRSILSVDVADNLKPNQAIWLPLRYAGDSPPGTVQSVGENSKICPNAAVAADSAICSSLGRFSI